ncbi:hypothetical protein IWX50DRAFT_622883 [Phyllosticta citricarpa]
MQDDQLPIHHYLTTLQYIIHTTKVCITIKPSHTPSPTNRALKHSNSRATPLKVPFSTLTSPKQVHILISVVHRVAPTKRHVQVQLGDALLPEEREASYALYPSDIHARHAYVMYTCQPQPHGSSRSVEGYKTAPGEIALHRSTSSHGGDATRDSSNSRLLLGVEERRGEGKKKGGGGGGANGVRNFMMKNITFTASMMTSFIGWVMGVGTMACADA